ncbi:MAG: preprotein translocase subunit SecA [Kiritimatiellaeota bacterium]|nr:preprotein translocase subunit SecA [Kiritimatiellota bacterium]
MIDFLKKVFGTKHTRDVKKLRPLVERINAVEAEYQGLSEAALKAKTAEFKERVAKGESLDDILPEAFAAVKNACRRLCGQTREVCGHALVWDMVPFDVQLMGGIVLHQGKISEMQTGEGKTLVATLPMYLNALSGKNVHLVTVNDYLARRDSQWMGAIYEYLGLTVGCIQNHQAPAERRLQYGCDITYGTNSEFGFDYLRDNGMATSAKDQVQRGYHFAIIDEVDSILIDEARTPLIISGPAAHSSNQYADLKPKVERLVKRQQTLVNDMVAEVRKLVERMPPEAGDRDRAMMKLYQVYHGMPKHKQLMHLLEDPAVRKLHEDVESMMIVDHNKEQARILREDLFFTIDERTREASLTDKGCAELNPSDPEMFVVPDIISAMAVIDREEMANQERAKKRQEVQAAFSERSERIHNVDQLLKAYCLYEKDVEYVVMENRVMIVDEFTGRVLPGRRWSDGLHQAVEAKEGVEIERESQTLATITIQNYFRMYKKLAGMTGTAETEAGEFMDIYKLDVVVIPTNRPIRRVDANDLMYKTQREKYKAIIEDVSARHTAGQPVLLGTVTVDTSEILSRLLNRAGIVHNVLNAKNHAREAEIVTLAGQKGAVTIATNMAGRGTDIKLGEGVVWVDRDLIRSQLTLGEMPQGEAKTLRQLLTDKSCGLHVIGSERHESRRIDRQLRGRCARQGDPGSSCFYISLEDSLMRLFGSERIANVMSRFGLQEGEAIEHRWLNRSVETAQRRVEQHNFSIRKRTLEYDDVMNKQREVVYGFRSQILNSENIREMIYDLFHDILYAQCEGYFAAKAPRIAELQEWVVGSFPVSVKEEELKGCADAEAAVTLLYGRVQEAYEIKCAVENPETVGTMERHVLLYALDEEWQDYLRALDELRDGVRLRAYGHRDPLVEYKREASILFDELMNRMKTRMCANVFRSSTSLGAVQEFMTRLQSSRRLQLQKAEAASVLNAPPRQAAAPQGPVNPQLAATFQQALDNAQQQQQPSTPRAAAVPVTRDLPKVGRNDDCPCGSGKKYKKCCGAQA